MKLKANLSRKPSCFDDLRTESGYAPHDCVVEKVVEIPADEFQDFIMNPLENRAFIATNVDRMFEENGLKHCLLVLGEGRVDGVLVESEGYPYAHYAAHIPNARALVADFLRPAVDYIVREGCEQTSEGSWAFTHGEILEQTGVPLCAGRGFDELLVRQLHEREEISDVGWVHGQLDVCYHSDFCPNMDEAPQHLLEQTM